MKKILIVLLATICILSNLTVSAADELDFNKLFEEAEEAASWFSGWIEYGNSSKLPIKVEVVPENIPERAVHDNIEYSLQQSAGTKNEMMKYLKTLFSDEIADKIFNTTDANGHRHFIEQNGYMYYWVGSESQYGGQPEGTRTFEVILDTATKKVYRMSYIANITDGQYYGGTTEPCCTQTCDYTVEWNGENWVFSAYRLPTDLWHTPDRCPNNPETSDNGMTAVIALCAVSAAVAVMFKKKRMLG